MTEVIAVIFDGPDDAHNARRGLRDLENTGYLKLDDAAVIVKDAQGKMHVKNEVDTPVIGGALIGGLLGVMVSFIFPLAGLALGALGGALVGKSLDRGVDKNFVRDVSEALKPGTSGLIIMASEGDPAAIIAELRPYKGTIFQTSISPELEETLRDVLKD